MHKEEGGKKSEKNTQALQENRRNTATLDNSQNSTTLFFSCFPIFFLSCWGAMLGALNKTQCTQRKKERKKENPPLSLFFCSFFCFFSQERVFLSSLVAFSFLPWYFHCFLAFFAYISFFARFLSSFMFQFLIALGQSQFVSGFHYFTTKQDFQNSTREKKTNRRKKERLKKQKKVKEGEREREKETDFGNEPLLKKAGIKKREKCKVVGRILSSNLWPQCTKKK